MSATTSAATGRLGRAQPDRTPSTALLSLVCGVLAGATFAAVTNQPSVRALGTAVLAVSAIVVTLSTRRVVGALVGLAWSVVAVGAAAQIRLSPTGAIRTLAVVGAAAVVVPLARAATARWVQRGKQSPSLDSAATAAVLLLALTLGLRLVPAIGGRLANGSLPVPFLGSMQVGEFTRPLFVLSAGSLLDVLLRTAVRYGWDARTRLLGVTGLLLSGAYLALLVVFDTGPAVLTVIALTVVVALELPRARVALRRAARGAMPSSMLARVGLAVIVGGLIVGATLVRLGAVDRWTRRLEGVTKPEQQVVLAVTAAQRGGLIGGGLGSQPLVTHIPVAGSDMLAATLSAELGLVLVGILAAVAVVVLATLSSAVLRAPRGAAMAAAVALLVALEAQLMISVLGGLGVTPMTGVTPPLLGVGGSSLIPVAAVIGFAVASVDTGAQSPIAPLPAVPRVAQALGAAVIVGCLALALSTPIGGGGNLATLMLPRGALLTRDGEVVARATSDGSETRAYPQGSLYADLGVLVRNYRATGVESTFGVDLTCGGASTFWERLASPVHPVPCRAANVVTTLDSTVQHALAQVMSGRSGSAVVLDALSGDVLGLYSTDQPDPNGAQPGLQLTAPSRLSELTPGSVLKPLVAAVALADGVSTAHAPADVLKVGGEQLRNEGNLTCPDTSLQGALAYSCNTVFGHLAVGLGAHRLRTGLDQTFGADQPFAFDGGDVVPLSTGLNDNATFGTVARTGIGQESVTVSPLALTSMIASIARAATGAQGPAPATHILGAVCSNGSARHATTTATTRGSVIDPANARSVMAGMAEATQLGTLREVGAAASRAGRDVAGKSGTADVPATQSSSRILRWASVVVDHRWVVTAVVRGQQASETNGAGSAIAALLPALPAAQTAIRC